MPESRPWRAFDPAPYERELVATTYVSERLSDFVGYRARGLVGKVHGASKRILDRDPSRKPSVAFVGTPALLDSGGIA